MKTSQYGARCSAAVLINLLVILRHGRSKLYLTRVQNIWRLRCLSSRQIPSPVRPANVRSNRRYGTQRRINLRRVGIDAMPTLA